MRIVDLTFDGVGPFKAEKLTFIEGEAELASPPVTIITGENGAGKTLILDAIRGLMMGYYGNLSRDIFNREKAILGANFSVNKKIKSIKFSKKNNDTNGFLTSDIDFNSVFSQKAIPNVNWGASYWLSTLSNASFEIKSLGIPDKKGFLGKAIQGVQQNAQITELICYFDYIRDSRNPKEKALGDFLYKKLEKIIKLCLNNGELAYVSKLNLEPIIRQNGQEISLDKLSSGNLYLIQRMVGLLGQMHAVTQLNDLPIEELCHVPGLLLIDEAENHLHPKWQKTFVKNILDIFPNLQIILTTHSPFIVSSAENARIYVCKPMGDYVDIVDETAAYSNMPVEEILMSPLFGGTEPFNEEISNLVMQRREAIRSKKEAERQRIEAKLQELNPTYFAYLDVEKMLEEITQTS